MCSYLRPRNGGIYYTRMVVPPRLRPIIGKSDLGRSLGTKDRADAKRLLPSWLAEAQSILAAAEKQLAMTSAPRAAPSMQPTASSPPISEAQLDWDRENSRYWLEILLEEEANAETDEAFETRLQQPEAELSPEEASAARLLKEARRERDRYRDRYHVRKHRDGQRNRQRSAHTGDALPADPVAPVTMLDTDIIDLWAAERKPRPKGIDTHKAAARWLYDRVGRKPVHELTTDDFRKFKAKLVAEGQSAGNIKMKLSRVRTLMQWAFENGHVSANAASGVTIKDTKAGRNERKPFDLPALNAIFASPVYTKGERPIGLRGEAGYWLPLLALFTGARLEELGQLRPDDVAERSFADDDGQARSAWFIHVREDNDGDLKLKNAESERHFPVHSELARLGFLTFVLAAKAAKQPRLFPVLRPDKYGRLTAKWSENWSVYRREACGVTDRRMVFHSFRHTFKDYARLAGIDEGIQRQLMGHSSRDVADDYGSGHSDHQLVMGMQRYKVPGLRVG